jgi:hypothetical protein
LNAVPRTLVAVVGLALTAWELAEGLQGTEIIKSTVSATASFVAMTEVMPDALDQGAAPDDSILPMTLVHMDYPSDAEADALTNLYQNAAQSVWVLRIGNAPNVPQPTDLDTAIKFGSAGRWTRGLLVQVCQAHHTTMSVLVCKFAWSSRYCPGISPVVVVEAKPYRTWNSVGQALYIRKR